MKLSVSTFCLEERFGYKKAFELIKNAGFDAIDFNLDNWWGGKDEQLIRMRTYGMHEDEMIDYFKKISECANAYGLEVGQTHAVFGDPAFFKNQELYKKITVNNIIQTNLLNSKYIVIHPIQTPGRIFDEDYDTCHKLNLDFYRSLC